MFIEAFNGLFQDTWVKYGVIIVYNFGSPSTTIASEGRQEEIKISWAKEKVLVINPIERCISYEIMENNAGFKSYVATIEVLPINGDGQNGCKIEWSFVADPIEGWRLELLHSQLSPVHEPKHGAGCPSELEDKGEKGGRFKATIFADLKYHQGQEKTIDLMLHYQRILG
ncbi:hypothetical protein NC652_039381 [Populus alba x Populus x berolinensis]|nr:hypothetical protein NC652_039381 [Populus alba x Populus x berolinensis]